MNYKKKKGMGRIKKEVKKIIKKIFRWVGLEVVSKEKLSRVGAYGIISTNYGDKNITKIEQYSCIEETVKIIQSNDIKVVLDIGANEGQFAKEIRESGYEGRILSFEPCKDPFEELKKSSREDDLWECYKYGLGKNKEEKNINLYEKSVFNSLSDTNTYAENRFWASESIHKIGEEKIAIKTLNGIWEEVVNISPQKAFLKADTQGHNMEVIEGGGSIVSKVKACQLESSLKNLYQKSSGICEVKRKMKEYGLFISGIYSVVREKKSMRLIEVDINFVRCSKK